MSTIDRPLGATASGTAVDLKNASFTGETRASSSLVGQAGLIAVLLSGVLLSLGAIRTNALLPETIRPVVTPLGALPLAGPLAGLGIHLRAGEILGALTLMFVGYIVVVRNADRLSARAVLATIGAFILVVLLAPPLLSTDIFSYQAYARMFFHLHANPYTATPQVLGLAPLNSDNLVHFIGAKWISTPTVYGPLFTLISGLFQNTSTYADIAFSAAAFKTIAALSCVGILFFQWKAARLRGLNPVRGAALVGLNPLVVLYGIGGGHNDLLMMLFTSAAIWALLANRQRAGGVLTIAGAAIKLTGGLLLPFALVADPGAGAGTRRRRFALGAAVAAIVTVGVGVAVFGTGMFHMLNTLSTVQGEGGWQSVPGFLFTAVQANGASRIVSLIFGLVFVLICTRLLWRVYRGKLDWLDGLAWATFWLLMATSSILPWYLTWLLVPVALCANRRLWSATLAFSAWVLISTMVAYLPHSPVILGFQT